ncbi:MAG TPA: hypothetical protein VNB22_10400 [Pyrinomonadaceae bacterium]|nr:hypothetical protein [Pyrinomonadaceae bacterium]
MKNSKFRKPIVFSIIAAPLALLLGIYSAGAGHGNYFFAKILFPYTMLSTFFFQSITVPFILLAIAQFPLYGLVFALGSEKGKLLNSIVLLSIFHTLFMTLCFVILNDNFS